MTKNVIAALIALSCFYSISAIADGAILVCPDLRGIAIYATGGSERPGWRPEILGKDFVFELWVRNKEWDITTKSAKGTASYQTLGCKVAMKPGRDVGLDMFFVAYCDTWVDTFLFLQRQGKKELLMTRAFLLDLDTSVAVYEAECRDPTK